MVCSHVCVHYLHAQIYHSHTHGLVRQPGMVWAGLVQLHWKLAFGEGQDHLRLFSTWGWWKTLSKDRIDRDGVVRRHIKKGSNCENKQRNCHLILMKFGSVWLFHHFVEVNVVLAYLICHWKVTKNLEFWLPTLFVSSILSINNHQSSFVSHPVFDVYLVNQMAAKHF